MPDSISNDELAKQLRNEENTKRRYITPIIEERWDGNVDHIVMEYYFTDGKINIEGDKAERGDQKKADYMLLVKNNFPLALVEAKGEDHDAMEGYQQVIDYANILDIPFAYTTNGHQLIEFDKITGKTNDKLEIKDFPFADDLWIRYKDEKSLTKDEIGLISEPLFVDTSKANPKKPRYYQRIAINRTIEAIAQGRDRLLLVLATGTGKTFTAFQICWKLWKSRTKKKILYLVDRNALADQTMQKDFKPFVNEGVMIKMKSSTIEKDTAYEVYTALYQQLKSSENDYYKKLPPDFFDFIIVDECHRGSANKDSEWHEILEYFKSATQLGMTATPKETTSTSNIEYFGEPIYIYSLRQGIEDGFLAPYKVVSVELNIDKDGYVPASGEVDIHGKPLTKTLYKSKDFDRTLVIESRRDLIAQKIYEYIEANNLFYSKMIIFCENIQHADGMLTRLKNLFSTYVAENPKYIMKITGDDDEGKKELDSFIDPNSKYPVIAITSELLSTGVDTETVETIVLDKAIGSMTEFKQVIGRGTRIKEEFEIDGCSKSKMYFTILDFRGNYNMFNDPEFDGPPISVIQVGGDKPFPKPKKDPNGEHEKQDQLIVVGNNVMVDTEKTRYLNDDFKLVQENKESQIKNNITGQYPTYQDFVDAFQFADNKDSFTKDLLLSNKEIINKIEQDFGEKLDKFDIIGLICYDVKPVSKRIRLQGIFESDEFNELDEMVQDVLKVILYNYLQEDYNKLRDIKHAFKSKELDDKGYSAITILKTIFNGDKEEYLETIDNLEKYLYKEF